MLAYLMTLVLAALVVQTDNGGEAAAEARFDPQQDLISLHYDHAPDQDDGHSAAADMTMLLTEFDKEWVDAHTLAVSGAYGENKNRFNPDSDKVMDAVFGDDWIAADKDWDQAVDAVTKAWSKTLADGGDIWVKEGGQSDITADIIRKLKEQQPDLDIKQRIHVVQHSGWNERQTTDADLEYVREQTDYINIDDANAYLNHRSGNEAFAEVARNHPTFGKFWQAAFEYYDPSRRLDFSDTGELMHILGLEPLDIDAFRARYLDDAADAGNKQRSATRPGAQ